MKKDQPQTLDPVRYRALAFKMAIRYGATRPVEDSWQYAEAWVGLCQARDSYRPELGASPTTYAWHCVKNQIVRNFQMMAHPKRGSHLDIIPMSHVFPDFEQRSKNPRSGFDLAVHHDKEIDDLHLKVLDKMRFLDPRYRRILCAVIMEGQTLDQVGEMEGMSKERVRQIVGKAINRLQLFLGVPLTPWRRHGGVPIGNRKKRKAGA